MEAAISALGSPLAPLGAAVSSLVQELAPAYWGFLTRGFGVESYAPFTEEVYPAFWLHCALSAVFFCSLFLFFPAAVRGLCPEWHARLAAHKRKELPSYVVCMVHHVVIVPWAVLSIWADWQRGAVEAAAHDYRYTCVPSHALPSYHLLLAYFSHSRTVLQPSNPAAPSVHATAPSCSPPFTFSETGVVPILVGYLVADLLCSALPQLQWEYLLHHGLSLWLTVRGCLALPPYTARFIPHLLLCDATQLT